VYVLDSGQLRPAMLHTCASLVKRDCVRTTRPFLTKVASFPWTFRHGGRLSQSVAFKDSQDDKRPVAVADASLLSTAGLRNQSHLHHRESPEDRMTRLRPDKTGLPMHINISVAQPLEFPCIKVNKTTTKELPVLENMFSVDIPADPYYRPPVRGDLGEITQDRVAKGL